MKKYVFALCFLAATSLALAAGGSVIGNGGVSEEKEGVATFWMNIRQDNLKNARFVFASEGTHGDYPDVVFSSTHIVTYIESENTVMIQGHALLYHMIPVEYMARFVDGGRTAPDSIELHAWNSRNMMHIVHFEAELTAGNIIITPGK
jgi:hypothetical protein